MESSLGPRRRSTLTQEAGSRGGGVDLISALPDELLLLVLARLPCAGAAARTGILSRRWRGLWAHLRKIVLRDMSIPSIEAALSCFRQPPPAVALLKIRMKSLPRRRVPEDKERGADIAGVNLVLRAAARLEPEKLVCHLPSKLRRRRPTVDLSCFHGATSIALDLSSPFNLQVPAGAGLPALETLSLSCCKIDLNALFSCCPRLRTLRLIKAKFHTSHIKISSPALQELVVERDRETTTLTQHVDIVAPVLKQLTILFVTKEEVGISVLAPMVEKVLWDCCYCPWSSVWFDLWSLTKLRLRAAESRGQLSSLHIHAYAFFQGSFNLHNEVDNFTQEIEKHMVAAFSVLELHLTAKGHAYGAFVFHLLGMDRIRTATRKLKVVLLRSQMKGGCQLLCPCEFRNWRSQTISLAALEEVEFNGFKGVDHEFDLLKLILGCAPTLKRIIVKLSQKTPACNDGCSKIYTILKACPSVECDVYHGSGLMHGSQNCQST